MTSDNNSDRFDAILADYLIRIDSGEDFDLEDFIASHEEFADQLREYFSIADQFESSPESTQGLGLSRSVSSVTPLSSPRMTVHYFGDYELLEEIARGGMGVVYKARQVKLNRLVAVKMILSGVLATEQDVERFKTEAETAANLKHPNIVDIHEIGEHDGLHYFSMELVVGQSLAESVRNGPLEPRDAASIVRDIANAVAHAHEHDVLHRDLKPSNILIGDDNSVHITDFGLAKRVDDTEGITLTGEIVGTPSYMSPEQALGKSDQISTKSDIYSIGAILFELLTGSPPFAGTTPANTIRQVIDREAIPPRTFDKGLPKDLETICLRCLEKEPTKRPASALLIAEELERYLGGVPIHLRRISPFEKTLKWCRRNNTTVCWCVASLLALGAIGMYVLHNATYLRNRSELNRWLDVASHSEIDDMIRWTKQREVAFSKGLVSEASPKVQARFAVLALHLGETEAASSVVNDPAFEMAVFVHDVFPTWHGDLSNLANQCQEIEQQHLVKSAVCWGISKLERDQLGSAKEEWLETIAGWYRHSTNWATHSASLKALQRLGAKPPNREASDQEDRNWYVTSSGITMVRIPGKRIYMSAYKITREQYENVMKQSLKSKPYHGPKHPFEAKKRGGAYRGGGLKGYNPDLAEFCRRLSESNKFTFRLPTQDEWKHACKAGTNSTYYFGNDQKHITYYEWSDYEQSNGRSIRLGVTRPVGQKFPNNWGLFDMYGNGSELFERPFMRSWGMDTQVSEIHTFPLFERSGGLRLVHDIEVVDE